MSKQTNTKVGKLPRIEPAFIEALEAIAKAERWSLAELLADIKKQPGTSMAAKARLYALDYYRGNTVTSGFAESSTSPFEAALHHLRNHKTSKKR